MTAMSPEDLGSSELVAVAYPDNSGVVRAKVVPAERLSQAVTAGVGMSPVFDVFGSDDVTVVTPDAGGPVGDLRLFPDPEMLRDLPTRGLRWSPAERRDPDGGEHPQCHRSFARRMVERAGEAGVSARMGFEIEWVAGARDDEVFTPVTSAPAYGMARVTELAEYLAALRAALARAGIGVEQLHPEYSPGQFEVAICPRDPVGAADEALLSQEVIRSVSRSFSLAVSFSPVVWSGSVGNGRHLHLSVWRGATNLFGGGTGPRGLTAEGESFLAGVLASVPALAALASPSPVSFERLVPHHWSAPFVCWGLENREAALRLVTTPRSGDDPTANAELKIPDATGSPYLLVGAVLACGLEGIRQSSSLPPEVTTDPATTIMPDGAGAREPRHAFPSGLTEALDALEGSAVLAESLGGPLHRTYLAVRRAELERAAERSVEERVVAYRFRY